jgi:hypothetical protein
MVQIYPVNCHCYYSYGRLCSENTENGRDSFSYIEQHFQDPPAAYRPAPFWIWHEVLTKEKIREQLTDFREKGIGGVFVHPRYGLVTEYLSEEWFEMFAYTLEVAKELDMEVWIYDENSFPEWICRRACAGPNARIL